MKNKITLLFLIFGHGFFAWGLDTKWHAYSLSNYPPTAKGCQGTAKELGETFSKTTGQSVFRATCEKETSSGYEIQISYLSNDPVRLVSTSKEAGGLGYKGLYRTMQDCLKALPEETRTFEASTGLTPFVSYCYKESSITKTPYATRVDAFGEAKLYPYRYEFTIFANSIEKQELVLNEIFEATKDAKIKVHQVMFADDGSTKLVIRYYSEPKNEKFHSTYFRAHEISRYSSRGSRTPMQNCRTQLEELKEGFFSTFKTEAILFCGWDSLLFDAKLYFVRIRPQAGIKVDTSPDRYLTFEACDRERAATQTLYEKIKLSPFTILCSWKSGLGTGKPDAFRHKVLLPLPELEPIFGFDPDLGFDDSRKESSS